MHISIWTIGVYYEWDLIDRYPELWQGVVGRRVSGSAVDLQQQDQDAAEEWRDGASSAAQAEASEEELRIRTAPEHTLIQHINTQHLHICWITG